MLGLILAALYSGYLCVTGHHNAEIVVNATGFLFYWFAFWSIGRAIFTLVISIVLPVGGAIIGGLSQAEKGNVLAAIGVALLGSCGGMLLAGLLVLGLLISVALKVGGAYLMSTAITGGIGATAIWDTSRLWIGGILLVIGVLFTGSSSSSSSSKKSND